MRIIAHKSFSTHIKINIQTYIEIKKLQDNFKGKSKTLFSAVFSPRLGIHLRASLDNGR